MLKDLLNKLKANTINPSFSIRWYDSSRYRNIRLLYDLINSIVQELRTSNLDQELLRASLALSSKLSDILVAYNGNAKMLKKIETDPSYSVAKLNQEIDLISSPKIESSKLVRNLTLHQKVLAYGMLHDDRTATISYALDKGTKILSKKIETDAEFIKLISKFRASPFYCLDFLRSNMFNILKDTSSDRLDRLKRYIPDFFDFIYILDNYAFPKTGDRLYKFIPHYLMDGLSDMGSDEAIEDRFRTREKIYIDKRTMFNEAKDLFLEIFTTVSDLWTLAVKISKWIYDEFPYDRKTKGDRFGGRSIPLDEIYRRRAEAIAVCRHHAVLTQVLLQAFGIECWLLKCNVSFSGGAPGPHVSNLVKINQTWYLLDTTNPIKINNKWGVRIVPISEKDIDLNRQIYTWKIKQDDGIDTYTSRNNMVFRIKLPTKRP